ncbi:MAG: ester cyclase [Acidobacteria bacterium]|nr:ester cyclase [Acidobacteriota bacterium]MCI0719401.1 ester cyclase [Acidobacteriota bacterium]
MSTDNRAIARRLNDEVWNRGNLSAIDEILATGYMHHDPASRNFGSGPVEYKKLVALYRSAFPDVLFTIENLVSEGDLVVTQWTARGTQRGEVMGIAPTGRQVTVSGISIARVEQGRLAEQWVSWDALGMLRQLGVVPGTEQFRRQAIS